jgi:hypothetical protein
LKICKKKTFIFFRFYVMHFWVLSQAPKPENPPYPSPRDMPSPMSSPPSPVLCGNTLFDSDNPTAEESQNYWKILALTAKPANPRTPPESKTTQLWLPTHFFFAAFFQKYFPVSCRLGFWGGAGVSVPERRFFQLIPSLQAVQHIFACFWHVKNQLSSRAETGGIKNEVLATFKSLTRAKTGGLINWPSFQYNRRYINFWLYSIFLKAIDQPLRAWG